MLRAWPYHRIICWGYSGTNFQWQAFESAAEANALIAFSRSGSGSTSAAVEYGLMCRTHLDTVETTSTLTSFTEDGAAPKEGELVMKFIVRTSEGSAIEAHVMSAVRSLMSSMESKGVPEDEFAMLLATLNSLAEDSGAEERAIPTIKQMCLSRLFDVKQAVQLVQAVGNISPFDKVEAAVVLFDRCLSGLESYHLVLACFEEVADRENICHRLSIKMQPDGSIVALTVKAAKAAGAL